MNIQSTFELPEYPQFSPLELIDAAQEVPLYKQDRIPIYVAGKFPLVTPRLQAVGMSAVRMTLNERPFEFEHGEDGIPFIRSQQMDGIVLASQGAIGSPWKVSVETLEPLNEFDPLIILEGLKVYLGYAAKKVRGNRG